MLPVRSDFFLLSQRGRSGQSEDIQTSNIRWLQATELVLAADIGVLEGNGREEMGGRGGMPDQLQLCPPCFTSLTSVLQKH
ncbi:hypothetical protein E2C01_084047 [Portunus trituberculatus]|uniref:Uncharacterized protein n=1 Tax=Portunus trituberculatus TaxID=210409 RepID=A0A5B7J9M6_PORTR|nr:hypothetical protein [Portunus trituberculatus]